MIVTNINSKDLERYASLHPRFAKAFDEMKRILAEGAEDGKIVLDGDSLFINVQSYSSKPESDCGFEAHKKYIDIQLTSRERRSSDTRARISSRSQRNTTGARIICSTR